MTYRVRRRDSALPRGRSSRLCGDIRHTGVTTNRDAPNGDATNGDRAATHGDRPATNGDRAATNGDRAREARQFEEHRAHLRAVAYRMLGSLSEADDAV